MSDLSNDGPIGRWAKARNPERRCAAHKKNGEQCRNFARRGTNVCDFHGAKAPQVKRKAQQRIEESADRMVNVLLGIALSAQSESVRLAAVKDVLDRAGVGSKQDLELSAKPLAPWEELLGDLALEVGRGTRAEYEARKRARYGVLPEEPPARAAREQPTDVVDAEVVPPQDMLDYRPRATVGDADRRDAVDVTAEQSATSQASVTPPPRALNQDEAADVMRASRAREAPMHRGRRRVRR
jgi:hypothetical protein